MILVFVSDLSAQHEPSSASSSAAIADFPYVGIVCTHKCCWLRNDSGRSREVSCWALVRKESSSRRYYCLYPGHHLDQAVRCRQNVRASYLVQVREPRRTSSSCVPYHTLNHAAFLLVYWRQSNCSNFFQQRTHDRLRDKNYEQLNMICVCPINSEVLCPAM